MDEELATSRDQRTVDTQQLNTLSVLHFVGAGLAFLGVAFVAVHFMLMSTLLNAATKSAQSPQPPDEFFQVFRWFYVIFGAWLGSSLLLNVLAGIYLRAKKHRTFCIVVAAINCLHTPLGTILGIFTIIVLARDSVRAAFRASTYVGEPLE